MKDGARKSGRWTRIFVFSAVLYAIPIAFAAWANFPTRTQIEADTAANALAALQQYEPKYRGIPPESLRRRLYRGLTDADVVARVREYAVAEETRMNIQGSGIRLDPGQPGTAVFSGTLNTPGDTLAGAMDGMRPQIAVTMDEVEKQREERLASMETRQMKVIAWAVAGWVLPLAVLYLGMPRVSWRSRKTVSRI